MKKSDIYKNIKNSFSREESFLWWEKNSFRPELGVVDLDTRTKKFSFRSGDNTPSTTIYQNLNYIDFGGEGILKDPLSRIMEVTGMSFPQALDLFLEWEGQSIDNYRKPSFNKPKDNIKEVRKPFSKNYIRDCILNTKKYADRYNYLKKGLFRASSDKEIKIAERLLSIGFIPKSEYEKEDRIFIPEFSIDKVAYGCYKYNRESKYQKGLLRKNSKRVLFGSHLLHKYPNDIIYSEGHTDTIANISKKLACVTTGSSTKSFGDNISYLAGKTLHDFPDLDIPGMIGATKRGLEIEEWNKKNPDQKIKHIVYWWSEWFFDQSTYQKYKNGEILKHELFFDIIDKIPKRKESFLFNINILNYLQKVFLKKRKIKEIPEYLNFNNWVLLSKKVKKKGYDFIDFHNENQNSKNYNSFLKKFTFN
jgi:hypothetical protein